MSHLESFLKGVLWKLHLHLLGRTNQMFDFRDMFIFGHTVEVHLLGIQFMFANRKLAIYKDICNLEIVFPIKLLVELVECSKHRYNNVPLHGRGGQWLCGNGHVWMM